ncbi:unnamed protein product [Owenia fusiformis]|nr:unnamed protein product [Owenia fusiformis]
MIPVRRKKSGRLDDSHIRERLKQNKDGGERRRSGPLVARASGGNNSTSSLIGRLSSQKNESAFTRQVVNRPLSPVIPPRTVKLSPSNSFNTKPPSPSGRRTPSPNSVLDATSMTPDAIQKRVEKVRKARLYLLQQMGPNSFLIGGDSPDHKFRVIIGEQTCSCGKAHCVHVLFVMLRVFQIEESDPCLWRVKLKNYEVETLFTNFHQKRRQQKTKKQKRIAKDKLVQSCDTPDSSAAADTSVKDVEEQCPICLNDMLEGESLVKCEHGCQNQLHQHCISIWFEECRRQWEQLICPLCRMRWDQDSTTPVERQRSLSDPVPPTEVPPNTQASSPSPSETRLPYAEPVPDEHQTIAQEWIPFLGENLVSCIFSRNWAIRETALEHLIQDVRHLFMHHETGGSLEEGRVEGTLRTVCQVLVMTCGDPVYRVYVAALRTLRTLLLFTSCKSQDDLEHLRELITPVVHTILIKCGDGNRRTAQLSMSTLAELAKGNQGELAVGRELPTIGHAELGSVKYVTECILQEYDRLAVSWQWLLGRICMLDRLLEDYPEAFTLKQMDSYQDNPPENSDLLTSVLRFSVNAVDHVHTRIGKLARRVVIIAGRMSVSFPSVLSQLLRMLDDLHPSLRQRLRRRLLSHDDCQASYFSFDRDSCSDSTQTTIGGVTVGESNTDEKATPNELIIETNADSPAQSEHSDSITNAETVQVLYAPPNSPRQKSSPNRAPTNSPASSSSSSIVPLSSSGPITPPSTPHHAPVVVPHNTPRTKPPPSGQWISPIDKHENKDPKADTSKLDKKHYMDICVIDTETGCCQTHGHNCCHSNNTAPGLQHGDPTCEACGFTTPERGQAVRGDITEDLSDLTMSPCTPEDRLVSFKSEIARSPRKRSSVVNPPGLTDHAELSEEMCPCKEEMQAEEDLALVKALESSLHQTPLPNVPGLTDNEETPVIIQNEDGSLRDRYVEDEHWVRGPVLGTGAFSTCYQARDIKTGVLMAVKQISFCRNSASEQQKVIDAIETEIHMMVKLSHPNIVRIMGATKQSCHFNMFVEWMPGGSIAYLLDRYGAFSEAVTVRYIRQVLRGLAVLHDNHILHRDLKGANLLVDSTGQNLRIADFGAAARLASQSTGAGEFQGQLLGTIAFMAPEVLRGESYGRSCDIWGVGCCIIEMVTTKPPWGASDLSNHLALIFKIASSTSFPPVPENISPPVKDVLLRCLEQKRDERPQAKDLLQHPLFTQVYPT